MMRKRIRRLMEAMERVSKGKRKRVVMLRKRENLRRVVRPRKKEKRKREVRPKLKEARPKAMMIRKKNNLTTNQWVHQAVRVEPRSKSRAQAIKTGT